MRRRQLARTSTCGPVRASALYSPDRAMSSSSAVDHHTRGRQRGRAADSAGAAVRDRRPASSFENASRRAGGEDRGRGRGREQRRLGALGAERRRGSHCGRRAPSPGRTRLGSRADWRAIPRSPATSLETRSRCGHDTSCDATARHGPRIGLNRDTSRRRRHRRRCSTSPAARGGVCVGTHKQQRRTDQHRVIQPAAHAASSNRGRSPASSVLVSPRVPRTPVPSQTASVPATGSHITSVITTKRPRSPAGLEQTAERSFAACATDSVSRAGSAPGSSHAC